MPYAFLAGLARTAVAGSHGVRELVTRFSATADPVAVRQAFADALGDPTVSLAYRLPERDEWVGASGLPIEIGDHAVTEIVHQGRLVAALVHDPVTVRPRRASGRADDCAVDRPVSVSVRSRRPTSS